MILRHKTEFYYAHIELLRHDFKFLTKTKPKMSHKTCP